MTDTERDDNELFLLTRAQLAEAEAASLRAKLEHACARIASQSDALSRTAEGRAVVLLDKLRRLAEGLAYRGPARIPFALGDGTRHILLPRSDQYRLWYGVHQDSGPACWYVTGLDEADWHVSTFAVDDITLDPEDAR